MKCIFMRFKHLFYMPLRKCQHLNNNNIQFLLYARHSARTLMWIISFHSHNVCQVNVTQDCKSEKNLDLLLCLWKWPRQGFSSTCSTSTASYLYTLTLSFQNCNILPLSWMIQKCLERRGLPEPCLACCLSQQDFVNGTTIVIHTGTISSEMKICVHSLTNESSHRDHGQSI